MTVHCIYNVNIINQQFSNYFAKLMDLQEILCTQTLQNVYTKRVLLVKQSHLFIGAKWVEQAVNHKMDL